MNPLFHELFQKTRFLNRELNHALKNHDLFAAQWTVLFCIQQQDEMTLTQIWKYLNVEAPTVTRTVNRLEELGWLKTREGKDRREKVVSLSRMAKAELPKVKESVIQFENRFLESLTAEEQSLLMSLLKKTNKERS
ncbi:MarR family transcriptional regulator [Filibacter tadaridae]|uniref:Transcriptional regulator SlyA n=1 Tax=Filibacter tadaridae TaxID=2483811 RepID=A0A3P5XFB4_9BACL|nr:MarR family transcriptional regulator [Filibacter tadaridae]VDC33506.1 Transcriptional regulator SlyA [Filibacter tadaridae]